jgi:Cu-processing system permease protein
MREVQDGLRNRWVAACIFLLTVLALALYLLGAAPAGNVKASAMSVTVVSLAALTVYLLPLIALMLSFDAFVGEFERGTLFLLLTYPVRRWQIVAGKFIGHITILLAAIVCGYGGTAVVIAYSSHSGWHDMQAYAGMMVSSWLLGIVFIGIGYVVSVVARERATAVAVCVGLWLIVVVLYDLSLLGLAVANNGEILGQRTFAALLSLNPTDAYRLMNLTGNSAVARAAGMVGLSAGGTVSPMVELGVLAVWAVLPVAVAVLLLQRREL